MNGDTPLMIARKRSHDDVVAVLESAARAQAQPKPAAVVAVAAATTNEVISFACRGSAEQMCSQTISSAKEHAAEQMCSQL